MAELREAMQHASNSDFRAQWEEETDGDGGLTAAFDSSARNALLDEEGVCRRGAVPGQRMCSGPAAWLLRPLGRGWRVPPEILGRSSRGSRAHNRWLADFVSEEPERRIGVAVIPAIIPDMDTVLKLVREAKDLGHRGILIPTRWFDRPAYHDLWYDPLWALTEELELVLHTHSGAGPTDIGIGPGMLPIYAGEAGWWASATTCHSDLGRGLRAPPGADVLDGGGRHGAWWVPDQIRKMDREVVGRVTTRGGCGDAFRQELTMKPSELPSTGTASSRRGLTPGEDDIDRRYLIGVGNLIWGNDIPHPKERSPTPAIGFASASGMSPKARCDKILGLTAAGLYGCDLHTLAAIAEAIGPTLSEVHGGSPLKRVPVSATR